MPVPPDAGRRRSRHRRTPAAGSRPTSTPTRGAREFAVDPRNNVVLEASAGTGKTSVLVCALREPAEGGRRARQHPGDHVHAQGGGRDARAHRPRAARRGRAVGVRQGALDRAARSARRRSRSARSTRSACRCCASSRSRRTSIPASRWRTRPRCRGSSRSRSTDRCGSSPAWPSSEPDIALVLAQLGLVADARRAGGAARPPARGLGRARSLPGARARRPDRRSRVPARGRRRCRTRCAPCRAGWRGSSRTARSAIRGISCWCASCGGCSAELRCSRRRCARSARLLDRVAAHFLTADGQPAAAGAHPPVQGRARLSVARRRRRRHRDAPSSQLAPQIERVVFGVRARPERRPGARHQADVRDRAVAVPPGARRAVGARLLGRAAARARPAAADGRVLAEPLPARVALPPRAGRRVPGHEPCAVGAGLAAGPVLGRGARPRHPALDLHRRRPEAVDLPLPRRRGRGAAGGGPLYRGAAAGRQPAAIDRAQLPRACRSCWRSSTTLFTEMSQPGDAAGRVHLQGRAIDFPCSTDRPIDAIAAAGGPRSLGHRGRPTIRSRALPRWRPRSRASCARRRPRPAHRRAAAGARRATSPSCSARAPATASSSTSSSVRGIPTYVYKGLGFFDADEIKDVVGAAALSGASRRRTCERPRSCARASSGCRMPGSPPLAPDLAAALVEPLPPSRDVDRSTTRIAACSLHVRGRSCRVGSRRSIAFRRPTCWSSAAGRPPTPTSCAGRGDCRRGRTSRRSAA